MPDSNPMMKNLQELEKTGKEIERIGNKILKDNDKSVQALVTEAEKLTALRIKYASNLKLSNDIKIWFDKHPHGTMQELTHDKKSPASLPLLAYEKEATVISHKELTIETAIRIATQTALEKERKTHHIQEKIAEGVSQSMEGVIDAIANHGAKHPKFQLMTIPDYVRSENPNQQLPHQKPNSAKGHIQP